MILVDGHVHIYDCYDLCTFFDSAYANFSKAAKSLGENREFTAFLLLAERKGQDNFSRLKKKAQGNPGPSLGHWKVELTDEEGTLKLTTAEKNRCLYLIYGLQNVSSEGIEVLSLFSEFQENLEGNLMSQVGQSDRSGSLTILPWAFGKWLGKRGRAITALLNNENHPYFFMGDNGMRPRLLHSSMLNKYCRKGKILLSGTDTLPLPGEESRVGSFGFYLQADLGKENVAKKLKKYLREERASIKHFGKPSTLFDFLKLQVELRKL